MANKRGDRLTGFQNSYREEKVRCKELDKESKDMEMQLKSLKASDIDQLHNLLSKCEPMFNAAEGCKQNLEKTYTEIDNDKEALNRPFADKVIHKINGKTGLPLKGLEVLQKGCKYTFRAATGGIGGIIPHGAECVYDKARNKKKFDDEYTQLQEKITDLLSNVNEVIARLRVVQGIMWDRLHNYESVLAG